MPDTDCPSCGRRTGGSELKVLPGLLAPDGVPIEVQLVREYKGPTVDQVLASSPRVLDLLPGRVRSMQLSVDDGDLAGATHEMDGALGSLLAGPGHRRRVLPFSMVSAAMWLWFAGLLVWLLWLVV